MTGLPFAAVVVAEDAGEVFLAARICLGTRSGKRWSVLPKPFHGFVFSLVSRSGTVRTVYVAGSSFGVTSSQATGGPVADVVESGVA